jgi:hypothetical protein
MEQTFIKTIQGHTLEFNRILYPLKYKILSQEFEAPVVTIVVERDDTGAWSINQLEKLPGWVSEITAYIYEVIDENEDSLKEAI